MKAFVVAVMAILGSLWAFLFMRQKKAEAQVRQKQSSDQQAVRRNNEGTDTGDKLRHRVQRETARSNE